MARIKRVKKPTREQKVLMAAAGLDWKNWNVYEEDGLSVTVISKKAGRKRVLTKNCPVSADQSKDTGHTKRHRDCITKKERKQQ